MQEPTPRLTVLAPDGVRPSSSLRQLESGFDLHTSDVRFDGDGSSALPEDGVVLVDLTRADEAAVAGFLDVLGAAADPPPLLLTVRADQEAAALRAIRLGAEDYLVGEAPDPTAVRHAIRRAAARSGRDRSRSAALRRSEERLEAVVRDAPVVLFALDRDGVFTFTAGGALARLGLVPGEMVGRSAFEMYADHPGVREDLEAALRGEEVSAVREVGDVTFSTRFTPLRDESGQLVGTVGVATDRSGEARARQAREESEERFRALIEHSADAIMITGRDGVVRFASSSTRRVLGHDPDALVGRSLYDLVHPDDATGTREALRPALREADRVYSVTARLQHTDGSWRVIQSHARNLLDHPAVNGFVVNMRDVTERKELEAQLNRAQKMEAMGRLAGGVAHDFNNLLTIVKGNAQLLLMDGELMNTARDRVREIDDTADRAASLTRQLLTFSRHEAPAPETLDVSEVAGETLQLLRRVIGEDIEVVARLEPDLHVVADRSRMEQVIVNLAVNARDAMPRGGELRIVTRSVEMEAGVEASHGEIGPGRYAVLAVSDTGCGMALEVQRNIFDPFYTTKPEGQGTGLGLSTVWGVVRQAGGHIHVYSEPDQGTAFRIYLPLTDGGTRRKRTSPTAAPPASAPGTVLLVEDDPSVRRLVRTLLARNGYTVLAAASGEEALRLAAERDEAADLLMTDVVMPGMTGPHLAERLLARWPGLRILFTSGYSEAELQSRSHVLAHAHFIEKPFDAAELLRTVARSVGRPDRDGVTGARPG